MNFVSNLFTVFASSLGNHLDAGPAIAASRAGHVGLLDLEYASVDQAAPAITGLAKAARGSWGLKLRARNAAAFFEAFAADLNDLSCVVYCTENAENLGAAIAAQKALAPASKSLVELRDDALLQAATDAGADGFVAKGHEAGGRVGDETTFLLTQRLVRATDLPVIALGGVGPNTAASLMVAGAAGVMLDWQLALLDEASVDAGLSRAIARMDGSETRTLGGDMGRGYRVFWRADHKAAQKLAELDIPGSDPQAFSDAVDGVVDPSNPAGSVWLIGQDASFARRFADKYGTVAAALSDIAAQAAALAAQAAEVQPLAENSPLTKVTGTRYPIIQGPMTRVSDVADFAVSVADGGALPFLALALMRGPDATALIEETKEKIGDKPWGVGILGFVDDALREEQTAVIAAQKPQYALIAGGRPDQAAALEAQGIPTFLHVPSPGLLSLFLEGDTRRFIFEGRECGGHVGPRSSAVLWQQAVDAVLDHYGPEGEIDAELIFAGGIHDAASGAMVSALAAGLAARGAKIGVIVGTAYILTEEAVKAGAVLDTYQDLALNSSRTMLLESGPGHATRVVESPIVDEFFAKKKALLESGVDPDEVKDELEHFNVGRSRIASKGVDRNPDFGKTDGAQKFIDIPQDEQLKTGVYMIGQVANLHSKPTTIAALHNAISTESAAILDRHAAKPEPAHVIREGEGSKIAITGVGTILPKAGDFATYWENILDRVDAIEEVPERRWDWRRYYDADRDAPDKAYSKWGGFLDEIDFDPIRYGIPPNSMPSIEPLQLLALETVRQALENAGYKDGHIPDPELRKRTSVIIGVGGGAGPLGQKYAVRSSMPAINGGMTDVAEDRLPGWTEDSFPGILLNVIAGRVTNRFDLGGVNFTVDAACGSSLAAVMMAARELENGTSDMVIVGGADSFQNPFDFLAFSKTKALSPRGRCRTFDDSADGIAISEGLAMMVLRRLDQAEADGDRIYAVLRGVGGSSDGRDLSLTAPRPEGQESALVRAYTRAGVSPASIGLVEAHGTGTTVGDRTEIQSLSKTFANYSDVKQFCGVGSVKSMIGHTKAAAGCAGMIKLAMALHHRVLPSTLNVEVPNSGADFPASPFYISTETRPWMAPESGPRRAGVSAFGFGGTNFHAVLEEYNGGYLPKHQEPLRRNWTHELLLFSADDTGALIADMRKGAAAMDGADVALRDVAASLAKRFKADAGARFALVAGSLEDAVTRLTRAADAIAEGGEALRAIDPMGAFFSAETPLTSDQVAFLFPGQGSQYPAMAADLAMTFPDLRETLEGASAALNGRTPAPLSSLIYPRPTLDDAERAEQVEALKRTDVAQPAIGAVSLAILDLLRGFGLKAGATAGHSFGEFTALHAAGAFDAQTLLHLAHARGSAIMSAGGDDLGAMVAVNAGAGAVAEAIEGLADVTLANINAPDQTVVAGPTQAIEKAAQMLTEAGFAAKRLPVACGFHSDCVAPARSLLAGELAEVTMTAPDMPVYGNATAAPYPGDAGEMRDQLGAHLVSPVNFVGSVQAMHDAGARLFLEVGPGSVLTGLTGRILGDKPHMALPSDKKGRAGAQQLLSLLGGAMAAGLPLDIARIFAGRSDGALDVANWALTPVEDKRRAMLWKVDAANVRPINGTPQTVGFAARIEEDPKPVTQSLSAQAATPTAAQPAQTVATPAVASTPVAAPATPQMPAAPAITGSGAEAVMQRHQALMTSFLENNRAIMMQWLGGGAAMPAMPQPVAPATAAPAPVAPAPVAAPPVVAPTPVAAPAPAPAVAATPAPVAAPAPAETGPSLDEGSVTAALLALISDRTGYPQDMLDLDLNLEADLGIDSIKRVEILGALRGDLLPDAGEAAREKMGPVSRERSVRGIVTKFMEVAAEFAGPAPVAAVAAPAPVDAGPSLDEGSVTAALLALISDRTGYPQDMLDLDLNLEADLGIDSIKRVEILGALRGDLLPDAGEAAREKMGPVSRERSVRGIVTKFMEVAAEFTDASPAAASTPVAIVPDAAPKVDADAWGARFVMVPQEVAVPEPRDWVTPGATYVLTDDEGGVAAAVAKEIEAKGGTPLVLSGIDLSDDAALRKSVDKVAANTAGLIHCAPLRVVKPVAEMSLNDWRASVDGSLRALYGLLSALGGSLSSRADAVVMCATRMGGAFGFDGTVPVAPADGGAPGLLKTVGKEWDQAHVRAVDFANDARTGAIAEGLLAEAGRRDPLIEIGLKDDARTGLFAEKRAIDAEAAAELPVDSTSVVLVTGGARGITAKIVKHMAAASQPRFVLLGSSPAPEGAEPAALAAAKEPHALKAALIAAAKSAGKKISPAAIEAEFKAVSKAREIRAALAEITALGSTVEYLSCDVRDHAALSSVVEDVYARHGKIDGVLHGAGVIEDKLILDKELPSFDNVVRLKTESAFVLAKVLRAESLKFLVFFTSVAGRFGNRGQGDYGAANETVSKLARVLNDDWQAAVTAISWGPWDSGGMVSDEIKAQFNAMRIEPIDPAHGTRALELEVTRGAAGESEVVWGRGPWEDDMTSLLETYRKPQTREAAE